MVSNMDIFMKNYIEQRKVLLLDDAIPELNEIFENHGKKRGELVIDSMSSNAKELLKADYRFTFDVTDGTWWIPPETRVSGKPCLQKSSNAELTKACLHQNVLKIGKIIEENLEKKNLSQMTEALKGLIEFERFDCKKRCDFSMSRQRAFYLAEIEEMLEKHEQDIKIIRMCVESHYKTEYERIIHDLNEKHEEETCKCYDMKKEELTSTDSEICASKNDNVPSLPSSSISSSSEGPKVPKQPNFLGEDKPSIPMSDVENHLLFQKNLMDMKNASSFMHFICAEKKHYHDRVKKIEYGYINLLGALQKSLNKELPKQCVIQCKCPGLSGGQETEKIKSLSSIIAEIFKKNVDKYKPQKESEVIKILDFLKDECSMIIPKATAERLFCHCNEESSDTSDPTYQFEKQMLLCHDDIVDIKWDEMDAKPKLPSTTASSLDSMTSSDFVVNVDDIQSTTSSTSTTDSSKTSKTIDTYDFRSFEKHISSLDFNEFVRRTLLQFKTVNTNAIDYNIELVSLLKNQFNKILDNCHEKSKIVEIKPIPKECPGILDSSRCPGALPIRRPDYRCMGKNKKPNKNARLYKKISESMKIKEPKKEESQSLCTCTEKVAQTKEEYKTQLLSFPSYMIPIHLSVEEKEIQNSIC